MKYAYGMCQPFPRVLMWIHLTTCQSLTFGLHCHVILNSEGFKPEAGMVFWEAGEATFHLCSPWGLSFRLLLGERSFQLHTHSAPPSFPSEFRGNFFNLFMDSPLLWCHRQWNPRTGFSWRPDANTWDYGIPCFISSAFGVFQMRWGSVFQGSLRWVCSMVVLLVLGGVTARSCHSKCTVLKFWINNWCMNPASSADLDVVDLIMSKLHTFKCLFFSPNTFILFLFNWPGQKKGLCHVFLCFYRAVSCLILTLLT